jgi:hypothetical protein
MKNMTVRFFFGVCFLLSCDNEQGDPKPVATDNFISYDHGSFSGSASWIVFSDDKGKILHFELATPETHFEGFPGTSINMTIIDKYVGTQVFWNIRTYLKIAPESYKRVFPDYNNSAQPKGTHTLMFPVYDQYPSSVFSSDDICGFEQYSSNTQREFYLCDSAAFLYAYISNGYLEAPKYLFAPISIGDTTVIDEQAIGGFSSMRSQSIYLLKPGSGYVFLFGKTASEKELMISSSYFFSQQEPGLYYPEELMGTVFKSYSVSAFYSFDADFSVQFGYDIEVASPDFSFDVLDAQLNEMTEKNYPDLNFTSSGSADHFEAGFQHSDNGSFMSWNVYGPFDVVQEIKLPILTNAMKSEMLMALPEKFTCVGLTYTEDLGFDSYHDWYTNHIGSGGLNTRNRRYKGYTLGQ